MKISPLLTVALLLSPVCARAEDLAARNEFDALVKRVYNFDPKKLNEEQWEEKEKQLDSFWIQVKAKRAKYLPLLRAKVTDPKSRRFLRYDGANLLVEASPTMESKRLQVAVYSSARLDIIEERHWVSVLATRATEGFDVSKAAKRTLDDEKLFVEDDISNFEAAHILWGSQSEERSTPQLYALASNPNYAERESALLLLMEQATPQARSLILAINQEELSDEMRAAISVYLRSPGDVVPRRRPKVWRGEFVRAFNDILKGDEKKFEAIIAKVSDAERDAATVMLPSDLPLLRRTRRYMLRSASESSMEYYHGFTGIIFAVMARQARTV